VHILAFGGPAALCVSDSFSTGPESGNEAEHLTTNNEWSSGRRVFQVPIHSNIMFTKHTLGDVKRGVTPGLLESNTRVTLALHLI
jgi:hypothetical protein